VCIVPDTLQINQTPNTASGEDIKTFNMGNRTIIKNTDQHEDINWAITKTGRESNCAKAPPT
jgi:hypothetical protein